MKLNPMIGDEIEVVVRGKVVASYIGTEGFPRFIIHDKNDQEWAIDPHVDPVTIVTTLVQ